MKKGTVPSGSHPTGEPSEDALRVLSVLRSLGEREIKVDLGLISARIGGSDTFLSRRISELVDCGMIERKKRGVIVLPPAPVIVREIETPTDAFIQPIPKHKLMARRA